MKGWKKRQKGKVKEEEKGKVERKIMVQIKGFMERDGRKNSRRNGRS